MAIKPLEESNRGWWLKIIFILALILVALFFDKIYSNKNKPPISKTSSEKKVLGATIENIKKSLPVNIDKTIKKAEKATGEVLGEVTSFVTNSASKSAQTVSDFLFENTVGNLLKQIEKLPQKQQEKIKEEICK